LEPPARARKSIRVNLEARAATAQRRRARTRERLLSAAESVIAEKGVEAASIEELVRAAGVSRGTFYNYFPTTTDLLSELNRRVAGSLRGRLEELARRPVDPPTRLAASLHLILAAYLTNPVSGWVALQIATSLAPRQPVLMALFEALYREGVAKGQFRDVDIAAATTLCFGAIRMAQRDVVAGDGPDQSVQVVALVLAAFGVPYADAEAISRDEARAARAR
jgi:AcrR family transcriptional regulator